MTAEPARRHRIPLIMVAGLSEPQIADTAEAVRADAPRGTVVVQHDLRQIGQGIVRRKVRRGDRGYDADDDFVVLELAHGCVSCTLREDMLPLLRRLCAAPDTERIVIQLDPALEPEAICWAIHHVLVDERPVGDDVEIHAVITAIDLPSWLSDASGDEPMAERGLAGSPDDERTVAQIAVGQAEFADAIVVHGDLHDPWHRTRTEAVLARLAPGAPSASAEGLDVVDLLARVSPSARRGEVDGHHGPLLRGQPSLETDSGVSVVLFEERRPFHPRRLHDAFDVLLEGVIRTRGRVWVASQPGLMLWLESAGGGLAVGHAGPWLAALPVDQWTGIDPQQSVKASLNWDSYYGDRMQELVVIAHEASPREISTALRRAVLTDDELAAGEAEWLGYDDPFGEWHLDGCAEVDQPGDTAPPRRDGTV